MSAVWNWLKKEAVLAIAALCALVSALFVPPSPAYVDYLDLRVLCLLFCLMVVVAGFRSLGVFPCWPNACWAAGAGCGCLFYCWCFFPSSSPCSSPTTWP